MSSSLRSLSMVPISVLPLVFCLSYAGLTAQTADASRSATPGARAAADTSGLRTGRVEAGVSRRGGDTGPLLDAPVDRNVYVIGANDQLHVAVVGDRNDIFSLDVAPDGTILVPGVGLVSVRGLNVNEAEARVRGAVARYYRNVSVQLSLARVRVFKVFVVGDVESPGVREASAATRVSELLGQQTDEDGAVLRRRNILLRRASGEEVRVDLARFLQAGDLDANPTVREGDIVVVPVVDRVVEVRGRVRFPGIYEYRPGETLADFLSVANGGMDFPANAADSIRLVRYETADRSAVHVISTEAARGAQGRSIVVQPQDAIYLPEVSNFKTHRHVMIYGEVLRPGTYPIRPDTTTVRELIGMAGGFTPQASLLRARLRREPPQRAGDQQLESIPMEVLSDQERRILQTRSRANAENVVIDFERLFAAGGDALDERLRAGDIIDIPASRDEVTVIGAVLQPGQVRFVPNRPPQEYVMLAGGAAPRADWRNATLITAKHGTRLPARSASAVEPGDMIVIPYRPDTNWMNAVQTAGTIVSTVTTILLAITYLR